MNKMAILLAGILVLSSLSFAKPIEITDRYMYIHYTMDRCKEQYADKLLGDFDFGSEYTDLSTALHDDRTNLGNYGAAGDRAGFDAAEATTRADIAHALSVTRALRVYDIANLLITRENAQIAYASARADYLSCTNKGAGPGKGA